MISFEHGKRQWAIPTSPVTRLADLVLAIRDHDGDLWARFLTRADGKLAQGILAALQALPIEPLAPNPPPPDASASSSKKRTPRQMKSSSSLAETPSETSTTSQTAPPTNSEPPSPR